MFARYSMAGTGLVVFLLGYATEYFGLDIDQGTITETAEAIVQTFGFFMFVGGQLLREDLHFGLWRKEPFE